MFKPMRFEFCSAGRIIFGRGALGEAGSLAAEMGRRALVVTGRHRERAERLIAELRAAGLECALVAVKGEPTLDAVRQGCRQARDAECDLVVGIGGGSALDAAKAIGVMLTNGGDPLDYLEVIGRGQPFRCLSAPVIAIPTTAGTGAEVTRNAVLGSPEHRVKASLRSSFMLPRLALVDPHLSDEMPPHLTASTGLDALTQLIESFVSIHANPFTDALCRQGIALAARSLRRAFDHGDDLEARDEMALASLLSGLALANAGLGAVHGFAAPIGGMFPVAHGCVCAALLPHVVTVNIRALRSRTPQHPALERYAEMAGIATGNATASAEDGLEWLKDLVRALRGVPLAGLGIKTESFPGLIQKAAAASSMRGNPIALTPDEMAEILNRAL
ncbi:MAG: iron-containing alcohol dehydrogenase [Candidatus Omnitrophica bacterium]|nr:iron-containing alcohol dehydrogenase [Candidatus Omnitrophota bacterium]